MKKIVNSFQIAGLIILFSCECLSQSLESMYSKSDLINWDTKLALAYSQNISNQDLLNIDILSGNKAESESYFQYINLHKYNTTDKTVSLFDANTHFPSIYLNFTTPQVQSSGSKRVSSSRGPTAYGAIIGVTVGVAYIALKGGGDTADYFLMGALGGIIGIGIAWSFF